MMKQTRAILLTSILTLLTFGAVIYTSCQKDRCKRLICQNGGTCQDGFCYCTSGYTGRYCQTPNVSTITFKNKTFTPVTYTIGGIDYKIDTGMSVVFSGGHGDTLNGKAVTRGKYGLNVPLDNFKLVFPAYGNIDYVFNVSPAYFFLQVADSNSTVPEVSLVYVNYKQADSTLDVVTNPPIKNDGSFYYIGYYKNNTTTTVRLEKTPNAWMYSSLNLNDTSLNQTYKAIIH
ncbi:MAG: hypothetical protein KF744_11805 [Taibaiella sp.]|nr:hypothetical protein [Taibaiella sp.]